MMQTGCALLAHGIVTPLPLSVKGAGPSQKRQNPFKKIVDGLSKEDMRGDSANTVGPILGGNGSSQHGSLSSELLLFTTGLLY